MGEVVAHGMGIIYNKIAENLGGVLVNNKLPRTTLI